MVGRIPLPPPEEITLSNKQLTVEREELGPPSLSSPTSRLKAFPSNRRCSSKPTYKRQPSRNILHPPTALLTSGLGNPAPGREHHPSPELVVAQGVPNFAACCLDCSLPQFSQL